MQQQNADVQQEVKHMQADAIAVHASCCFCHADVAIRASTRAGGIVELRPATTYKRVQSRVKGPDRGVVIFVLGLGPDRRACHDRQNRAEAPGGAELEHGGRTGLVT